MSTHEQVAALIAPLVRDAGLVLDGVAVSSAGKRRLLRVTLDTAPDLDADGWVAAPTAPVGLDDVAAISRRIDAALEDSGILGAAPFVLEVSSPGVGRALVEPRHFQRNVGRLITARIAAGENTAEITGRILRAGPDALVLAESETEQTLPYAEIERAVVVVEFGAGADANGQATADATADRS